METPDGKTTAFLDIGTNSIRFLLVRINPNHSYTIINDEKEVIRLGEDEFIDQFLRREAMQRAALVCKQFIDMAEAYGANPIQAIATSATREAKNKKEFLHYLYEETGLDVRTVSGKEEARLIYSGVSSGINLKNNLALFIDIGGGSTEVIIGDQSQYQYLDSLKLGAIRLTSLFFLPEEVGPVPPARYALIQRYVRNAAVRTLQQIRQYRIDLAIGSSGTIENLADIAIQNFYKRPRIRDDVLRYEHLEQVIDLLLSLSLEERRKIPGINSHRADIIVAGAAILDTILDELEIPEILITGRGLRDGLLEDHLIRSEQSLTVKEMTIRESSVMQLGRACGFEEAHARHVARLSLSLFDSARKIGLHDLGHWERELLEYAALLHDIGTFLSHSNHQAHTYYLIKNADLLGFDQTETNIIATLGYFHRKQRPRKKHKQYSELDNDAQKIVKVLAVLLQLAESLDRSHASLIHQVRFYPINEKKVSLEIIADQDCQLEVWGVRNQKKAFKKSFGKKLKIEVHIEEES
jgi:exopolyphosphatase/guanosine-5'-triphosphate,3'-diphosphate pyrophosphatase